MFSNYPLGLDYTNTRYQVAELNSNNTETPYPNAEINTPPGGALNYSTTPPTAANYQDYFIGVQSVVIDAQDRLWILDTGRVALPDGTQALATYGGPKLLGVDISTDTVFQTIIFPLTIGYPDSYLNDIRFDLRPSSTSSGQGIAYITESSADSPNGIVVVDLGTGESWLHLDNLAQVRPEAGFFMTVWGEPVYQNPGMDQPITSIAFGADGIALSADGETLYFCPVSSRNLYSLPTARLRDRGTTSELFAAASVMTLGEKGVADGLETDSNGLIYAGSLETNSIITYNPENGTVSTYVRSPVLEWTDTFSVGEDGYVYFTENQLWRSPNFQGGVDRRVKPWSLWRVPAAAGAGKVMLE